MLRTSARFLALLLAAIASSVPVPALVQPAKPSGETPSLTVRFEGGDVPANAVKVLEILGKMNFVPLKTGQLGRGQSVCDLYQQQIKFPIGCSQGLVALAGTLNKKNYARGTLKIGADVQYPDVWFDDSVFTKRFDPAVPDDLQQLADLNQHWSKYVIKRETLSSGVLKVQMYAYELHVPIQSPEDAERATRALAAAHIPNITFTHPETQRRLLKYHSRFSPQTYITNCQAGTITPVDECAYSLMLNLPKIDWVACGTKCPDVYLIDKPVRKNPAFAQTVVDGLVDDTDPPGSGKCALPPIKAGDHGTHLAGIIGAAGPTCVGLNPAARIHSWNREDDAAGMRSRIDEAQDSHDTNGTTVGLPVFVFASSWGFPGRDAQKGDRLDNDTVRFRTNPIADTVASFGGLWIVAAGQPDETLGEHALDITKLLPLGPMNLGDQRNVLVVTACVNCASEAPSLRGPVNYSTQRMVHIAAPGDDIPGFAGTNRFGLGGGTSQAAAFVAGVASAMITKYPSDFEKPELAKSRLQYTSRPVLTGTGADRVNAGVIDPAVALLDPEKHQLQRRLDTFKPVALDGWCTDTIQLMDPDTMQPLKDGTIRTKDVLRMYRVNRNDATGQAPQWIFYTRWPWGGGQPGEVLRIGPGTFMLPSTTANPTRGIVKENGADGIAPVAIDDLLIRPPLRTMSCGV